VAQLRTEGYTVVLWEEAGRNGAIYNLSNLTTGPLFRQLYLRQALQHLVDQPSYITSTLKGSGVPPSWPVPALEPVLTIAGEPVADPSNQRNPYRYSPSDAMALLRSHGWAAHPGGVDSDQDPGEDPGAGPHECRERLACGQPRPSSMNPARPA